MNGSLKKRLIPVFEVVRRVLLFQNPSDLRMVQPSELKSRRSEWMNKELLMKIKHKKKFYKQWNWSWIFKEEHRDTMSKCVGVGLGKPKLIWS